MRDRFGVFGVGLRDRGRDRNECVGLLLRVGDGAGEGFRTIGLAEFGSYNRECCGDVGIVVVVEAVAVAGQACGGE
ncbi:hypothetical protein [Nocardia noduli]|uniref:hypothetical protein n=1 Tax=Nocardia noduli TaxID=2815722 RepID=UPI001C239C16|nr:hypothetical protein [Nocardia noduli]